MFVPPNFSSPSYANALQSRKRRITVSCHSLYTCIHIYKIKTSDLHRRSYVKNYFREKKTEPAIVYNTLRVCICIHFFQKMFRESPHPSPTPTCEGKFPHAPLPRLCADIGLHPCSKRWTCFWIPHWQCNVLLFCLGGGGGGGNLLNFGWVTKYGGWFVPFRYFVLSLRNNDNLRLFPFVFSPRNNEITTKLRKMTKWMRR